MKLLLVEDDSKIAAFIQKGLKQEGMIVEHADNGEDGLYFARENIYDAIIVDIMLPRLDGMSLIRKIRERDNKVPILVLSAKDDVEDRVQGLQLGADDYLVKPFAFSELLARLMALLRRSLLTPESTKLTLADLELDLQTHKVKRGNKPIALNPGEFTLLAYLMRNVGRVVTKTMIIEKVWDYNFDPATNVVEVRVCRLREKIDKGFPVKLLHTVRGFGYVLEEK